MYANKIRYTHHMRNLDWPITTRYITNTYFLMFKCFTAIGYTSICCPMRFTSPVANFLICITLGKNQWNRELAGWMDLKHYHHFFPSLLYNTHRELYPRFLSNWPIGCSNRKCLQFWRQIVTNTSFITLKPIKVKLGFIFAIMKDGILLKFS